MADKDKTTIQIIPINNGSGPNGTLKEGDDIKEEVTKTLGDYLSCETSNAKNAQRIRPGVQKTTIKALDPDARGSENPFAPSSRNNDVASVSNSGFFGNQIDIIAPKGEIGHDLLTGEKDEQITNAIQATLTKSRFSPGPNSPFLENGEVKSSIAGEQNKFGEYDPQGKDIDMEQMRNVGLALMMKAAGEVSVTTDEVGNGVSATIPGKAQLAIGRLDPHDLQAKNLDGVPQTQARGPELATTSDITTNKSWGVLNTPLEPFGGYMPIGMTVISTALVVSLKVVLEGFLLALSAIVKASADKNIPPVNGPFSLGQAGKIPSNKGFFSLKDIGIIPTEEDFVKVVNKGLDVFFDFQAGQFKRVAKSPGFYAVLIRSITRSGTEIIKEIADVHNGPFNPLGTAQEFIGLIDVLKSSKVIAFLNILAQMGERAFSIEELGFDCSSTRVSQVEHIKNNPASRVMKIHDSKHTLRSAYRNSATPSMFIFPDRSILASEMLGENLGNAISGLGDGNIPMVLENKKRISQEEVTGLEAQLDAEYVPFYFHDLRTNEIISFHAFLESLDDNYAPNYETTSAYGRVDEVETYKNTNRNLNFTFSIVATSKSDFDSMWWKINKLVTMVNPQWSKGRQVVGKDKSGAIKNFVQPFSQVPTASPVIRVRIGDVIRSNYSKFAASRLFGLGNPDTDVIEQTETSVGSDYFDKVADIRERMLRNPVESSINDGYHGGEKAMLMPKTHGGYLEAGISFNVPLVPILSDKNRKKLILTAATKVTIEKAPNQDSGMLVDYGDNSIAYYRVSVDGEAGNSNEMSGEFIVTYNDLYPDNQFISNVALGKIGPLDENLETTIPDASFFDSDQNSIIRAFESTAGKGLAGVIKGLNFTEMISPNVTWETTSHGSRAPKMIKCSIQYKVIHDIAPGIDDFGFNRAPQYPVGDVVGNITGEASSQNLGKSEFELHHREAASTLKRGDKK